MEVSVKENRLKGVGRVVPRLGHIHASLWGSREGQGLRRRCPEKVDSQQRPLSQTGPETEAPPPFRDHENWSVSISVWTEGTDTRGPFPECSVMWETPETLLISNRGVGREAPTTANRILFWTGGTEAGRSLNLI